MSALTLKLLGSALLVLAGALLGGSALGEKRAQERCLRAVAAGLGRLKTELLETCTPLPEAFSRQKELPFFALLAAGIGTEPTEILWRRASLCQPIPEDCRSALAALGTVIGRCAAPRQAEELERVRRELLERAGALQREIAGRAGQFPGLGAAAGAILAVLLF